MLITCGGMIGSGKSSLTKILSANLGTKAFYEPVENNPVLPLFYEGNKLVESGKATTNPYAFLLQIYFLNQRFDMIKKAMQNDNNILDRSIYEDAIFMKMNYEQKHTTEEEWNVYNSLLNNMMEELPYASHKKHPDLMIMIKASYPVMLKDIKKRGRSYEQVESDPSLESYYKELLRYYDDWFKSYKESPILMLDRDKYDFVNNKDDKKEVLSIIYKKLYSLGSLNLEEFDKLNSKLALETV